MAIPTRQSCPIGASTGSIALPTRPPTEWTIAPSPALASTLASAPAVAAAAADSVASGGRGNESNAQSTTVIARIVVPASRTKSIVRSCTCRSVLRTRGSR